MPPVLPWPPAPPVVAAVPPVATPATPAADVDAAFQAMRTKVARDWEVASAKAIGARVELGDTVEAAEAWVKAWIAKVDAEHAALVGKQPVSQQTIDEILSWSTSRLAQIVAEASTPSSSPTIEIEPPAL